MSAGLIHVLMVLLAWISGTHSDVPVLLDTLAPAVTSVGINTFTYYTIKDNVEEQ